VQAVTMDTGMDPVAAASLVPAHIALQGNLDPLAVVAGGAAMRAEVDPLLDAMRGRPFIFNLGHGLVPQTPPEHVGELVGLVRGH
jgi:uroporphyrinogen decarboxylase